MLRTPSAIEGEGGAISEDQARERGRMIQVRDQMAQLAAENGLKVSDGIALSLLPTPNTMEHRETKTPEQIAELKERSPGGYRNLRESVVNDLLPTTTTSASQRNSRQTMTNPGKKAGIQLEQAIEIAQGILPREFESWDEVGESFLPTPAARDHKDGTGTRIRDGEVQIDSIARAVISSGEIGLLGTPRTVSATGATRRQVAAGAPKGRLEDQVESARTGIISWGKFEPAIRRWEQVLGRIAPAPTRPDGKDGAHRLSPEFTEWMMGLPEGWITGVGLSRVSELKMAGNGVVPQQAALALEIMLANKVDA